jgi:hypothetical protein
VAVAVAVAVMWFTNSVQCCGTVAVAVAVMWFTNSVQCCGTVAVAVRRLTHKICSCLSAERSSLCHRPVVATDLDWITFDPDV